MFDGVLGGVLGLVEVTVSDVVVTGCRAVIVPMAVIVDEQRLTAEVQQPSAEGDGEMLGNEHLVGRPVGDQAPGEQHHPIGPLGLLEMMGGEHDGGAALDLLVDDPQDRLLARDVEPGDRLVEQQQARGTDERLSDQHPLPLSTREFTERPFGQVGDLEPFGDRTDLGTVRAGDAAEEPASAVTPHPQHLVDRQGHPLVMTVLLGDERRLDAVGSNDLTRRRRRQSGEELQHRALAAAVRADQSDRGARIERRRRPIERDELSITQGDLDERGNGGTGRIHVGQGSWFESENRSQYHVVMQRRVPLLFAVAALALAACGSDGATTSDDTSGSATDSDVPSVVATTTMWADITRNVACDGLAEVTTIIPAGADPHSFEPSLRDRETMGDAALIVANGLGLEESLEDTIDAVEADGVTTVRVGEFVDTLPAGDEEHADEEHADEEHADEADHTTDGTVDAEHDHGSDDPHIWFDPTRVTATLPAIADGLAEAGVDRVALDACVAEYGKALAALDDEISAIVEPLPVDDRLLVTNHDSLSYFADRYGFTILGSVIPSPSSLAATNPADLEALATLITDTGVPAIFAETQHSSGDTEALADRVGDVEVVTLQTDTLGEPGSDTDSYVSWLATTARSIVDALSQ